MRTSTNERATPDDAGVANPTRAERLAPLYGAYRAHVTQVLAGYAAALAHEGFDAVVLHSGLLAKRSAFDDQTWPLRPMPHFQHLCPLSAPDCAIVVSTSRAPTLVWVDEGSFWEQPCAPEPHPFLDGDGAGGGGGDAAVLRIVRARKPSEIADEVARQAPRGRVALVAETPAARARSGLEARVLRDDVNPEGLLARLDALRVTKTPYERACLAEANRRAAVGHAAVRAAFEGNDGEALAELDLHLLYLRATRQDDAETPYKNIVARGRSAATLHHVAYAKVAGGAAESLLLDAGATAFGYASDITRTWVRSAAGAGARSGTSATSSTFAALVHGVRALQQRLCAAVRVGMPYEALHDRSHLEIAAVLREVGLARGSVEEMVATGVTRAFFPHGLGHSLGLQCHDVGCALVAPRADNPFLRNTSIVSPGQCFTIEPGVYFIESRMAPLREGATRALLDLDLLDALTPFGGVRIEDDLVVEGPHEDAHACEESEPSRTTTINLTRGALAAEGVMD